MSREKYVVQLTDGARESLQKFVRGGTSSVREVARARILLKADDGWTVHRIAEALDVSPGTVYRIPYQKALLRSRTTGRSGGSASSWQTSQAGRER